MKRGQVAQTLRSTPHVPYDSIRYIPQLPDSTMAYGVVCIL